MPAVPHIMHALDTDPSGAAWTLTAYFLAAAVLTPIMGRLGDIFGQRRILLVVLVVSGIGHVISALGESIEVVVAGRVVQGIGGGIFPLCFGIIRNTLPPDRVSPSIGLISATVGVGGGAGLIIGGALTDHASYHWIFWLATAVTALAAACTHSFIPESPRLPGGRVDIPGAILLTVGLLMPLTAISQANSWGWGHVRTIGLITAGIVVLVAFWLVERRSAQPMVDVFTLVDPPVLMTNVATLLVGFAMLGAFTLTPQLAQADPATGYGLGLSATDAGLLLFPGMLGMLLLGALSGIVGRRLGNKYPLALGGAIASVGLFVLGLEHGSQLALVACSTVFFCGAGLAYAAMPNLIVEAVPPAQTGEATGVNVLVRAVGFSLGAQVCAAALARTTVDGSPPTDGGFTTALLISAGVALIAAAAALFITRDHTHGRSYCTRSQPAPVPNPAYASRTPDH
jgi:MFS family permease